MLDKENAYSDFRGQGLVEYSLIVVILVLGTVLVLQIFGVSVSDLYCSAASNLSKEVVCGEQNTCVDTFSEAGDAWNNRNGNWEIRDGQLCTSRRALTVNSCTMDELKSDYIVNLSGANLTRGNGYGVFFRTTANKKNRLNGYIFQYDPGYRGGAFIFRKWVNGRELRPFAVTRARGYDWYNSPRDVQVSVQGDTFMAYIDGELVLTGTDDSYSEGGVALRSWNGTEVCFDQFGIGSAP